MLFSYLTDATQVMAKGVAHFKILTVLIIYLNILMLLLSILMILSGYFAVLISLLYITSPHGIFYGPLYDITLKIVI